MEEWIQRLTDLYQAGDYFMLCGNIIAFLIECYCAAWFIAGVAFVAAVSYIFNLF